MPLARDEIRARRERRRVLAAMPYAEYLASPEWKAKRAAAVKRARGRCQLCNAAGVALDVHHRTYERRGREQRRDLVVLCRPCHETFHRERALAKPTAK